MSSFVEVAELQEGTMSDATPRLGVDDIYNAASPHCEKPTTLSDFGVSISDTWMLGLGCLAGRSSRMV